MAIDGLFVNKEHAPLAERLRPQKLNEMVGQAHLIGESMPIHTMIEQKRLRSMILWGAPGCGKTTLARLIAQNFDYEFASLSAVFSGVADLKRVFDNAKRAREVGQRTILFVDEIHRFNRAQQDGFLPYVEDGTIILIGATTENPSFELNSALLSRCMVFELHSLTFNDLNQLVRRAESLLGVTLPIDDTARSSILAYADGDGRYLLNMIEALLSANLAAPINSDELKNIISQRMPIYDKNRDGHYNYISALHKSVRGSDCDAALYWFCRMVQGGETPHFIARRMMQMAYEDIGLADPNGAVITLNAWQTYERLGSPEGELALANALVYLANAPKSNAVYNALKKANQSAASSGSLQPPKIILNAPTKMMKNLGYGDGYLYDHDQPNGFSGQNYFPDQMMREEFYHPGERGFEREMSKRLTYFKGLRKKRQNQGGSL